MRHQRFIPAALFLSLAALQRPAGADDKQTAKALFEEGVAKMEAKRYEEACPQIEQSLKLDPYPGTLFTLAECEAQWGHSAAAYKRYGEYLTLFASLPKEKQQKQGARDKDARTKRGELAAKIAELTVVLSAPSGTEVSHNGAKLPEGELGNPLVLDPGEHVFTTSAPDGASNEQRITLTAGEKQSITLTLKKSVEVVPTAAPSTTPAGTSPRRIAAFALGGVGAAGLILGAVTGGLMLAQMDAINAGCKDNGDGVALCTEEGAAAGNNAKTFGLIATVGLAAGAALAGTAIVLFVTEPRAIKAQSAEGGAPGGHISHSAYPTLQKLRFGVTPLGSLGTTVGVQGSF